MRKDIKQNHPIPGSKIVEDFLSLSRKILEYASLNVDRIEFLRRLSQLLGEFTKCDAMELFVEDEDVQYHWKAKLGSDESFSYELEPGAKTDSNTFAKETIPGKTFPTFDISSFIENLDSSTPFVTGNGSLWIGDLENPNIQDEINRFNIFTSLLTGVYKSTALIPFRINDRNSGIMGLMSLKKYHFTENEVEFFEGIAQTLGLTIAYRRIQAAMRERVKELTCLYGIAQLVAQPGIALVDALQNIVELLPPAMKFPDLAMAKIIFEGTTYVTRSFEKSRFSRSVPLIVKSENRGIVDVAYRESKPMFVYDPFLKEEEKLLETVAKEISLLIEEREAVLYKAKLQEQLRHADRLATIGQLAAGVAHELNEPLVSILGFAQLIKKSEELPTQAGNDMEKIISASLHAREIVKKLLIFARQMPTRIVEVNLNQIVRDGLYFLESRLAKEGIELDVTLAEDLPILFGDATQLQQILVNLVVNSVQAMKNGGKIKVKTWYDRRHAYLMVEDNGEGMTEEVLGKIFIPFFTTKDVGQGTGLGLPVVHGIVTSHGGSIDVKSSPGEGTRFIVCIPFYKETKFGEMPNV